MYVSRDPFAREEIHKEPVHGECDFCGVADQSCQRCGMDELEVIITDREGRRYGLCKSCVVEIVADFVR